MQTLTYPVVPEGPDAIKLNSLLVELKANSDIVELEVTENTFCSEYGVIAKLTILLDSLNVEFPSHFALIRQFPVTDGFQTTKNPPSDPVFDRVRSSHELPSVTLYEIKTDSPEAATSLNDKVPQISTSKLVQLVVLLQKRVMVGPDCVGEGEGEGVAVDIGSGVGVGVGEGVGVDDGSTYILTITLVSESSTAT